MKFYVDANYHCHTTNEEGVFREVEHSFFDNKCDTFIEGYRFIPSGESWVREDGTVFTGEMIAPWKDYNELDSAQRKYEKEQFNEYKKSLIELGVEV